MEDIIDRIKKALVNILKNSQEVIDDKSFENPDISLMDLYDFFKTNLIDKYIDKLSFSSEENKELYKRISSIELRFIKSFLSHHNLTDILQLFGYLDDNILNKIINTKINTEIRGGNPFIHREYSHYILSEFVKEILYLFNSKIELLLVNFIIKI